MDSSGKLYRKLVVLFVTMAIYAYVGAVLTSTGPVTVLINTMVYDWVVEYWLAGLVAGSFFLLASVGLDQTW